MDSIQTKSKSGYGGVKRNSYYDVRIPYSQREKDDYRISEGYSKKVKRICGEQSEEGVV